MGLTEIEKISIMKAASVRKDKERIWENNGMRF